MFFFCPRTPSWISYVTFTHHVSLGSSRQWQFFRLPLFRWPWQFSGMLFRYFLLNVPQLEFVRCFTLTIRLGFMGSWQEEHRGKVPFLIVSYRGYTWSAWPATDDVRLDHVGHRPCLPGFSTVKLPSPSACPVIIGRKSLCSSHVRGGELGPIARILVWYVFICIQFCVFVFIFFKASRLAHGSFYTYVYYLNVWGFSCCLSVVDF